MDKEDMRAHLRDLLPAYMVPSELVVIERFPLTPNGKLDTRALPAPPRMDEAFDAPRGEVEEILAGIWQELLHVERIGRRANFFELGGHSLLGIKLIAKVEQRLNIALSAVSIFQYSTLQEMAREIESLRLPGEDPSNADGLEMEHGVV
jgi:acyl carrier protein